MKIPKWLAIIFLILLILFYLGYLFLVFPFITGIDNRGIGYILGSIIGFILVSWLVVWGFKKNLKILKEK